MTRKIYNRCLAPVNFSILKQVEPVKTCEKNIGLGIQMPPLQAHVSIYFIQKGLTEKAAELFFQQHDAAGWKFLDGRAIKNWKTLACDWIWERRHSKKT